MERETDRFTVRAEDGRAWVFRKMQNYRAFQGQHLPGSYRYESLDDDDRYHLVEAGGGFAVRDFRADGPDTPVSRI
ncbi:hypothetical protein [Sphingomonas sp. BK580]|uniref:hypothetical protein n=1 Tax=Sphingomonas sp. BK580 TaxID=2586972 RepID=UPI001620C2AB|nr:hypothetical protein [Sphingomonas sp. BK580]MBB3692475.1 hypothetical protein [Sphingomonas sp. BK580]